MRSRARIFYPKADCELPGSTLGQLKTSSNEALGLREDSIAAAAAEAIGAASVQITALAHEGTFHRLFQFNANGRELVCKVAIPFAPDFQRALLRERAIIDFVRHRGIPVPAIISADVSLKKWPFAFLVMERATGTSMRAIDDDEAKVEEAIRMLVARLSDLHQIRVSGFGLVEIDSPRHDSTPAIRGTHRSWSNYLSSRLEQHLALCVGIHAITQAEAHEALSWLKRLEPDLALVEPSLLHGDPGGHNVFLQGGAVSALIDWEDALAGDPVYDFAFLATFHPQRRLPGLLAACQQAPRPWSAPLFWLYFLRVALAKTVHRHRFGYVDQPGREPGHRRIRYGLDQLRRIH